MSRDAILARIRAALVQPTPHHPSRPAPVIDRLPPPTGSLVERFAERFRGLGGHWHQAASGEALAAIVAGLASAEEPGPVWVARDQAGWLDRLDLAAHLEARGVRVPRRWADLDDPDQVRVAVTGVTVAIAESGTLGLVSEPEQGRLASVVTPVHLAVLAADQLVATLGEALARFDPLLREGKSSAAILITGPSRTADIEGQLVVGVHGPGEVHCVLVGE
jgi:L-lactate dehydrogenase complex protein LldG